MAIICPAILAKDTEDYKKQIENVESFAQRVQVDLTDGIFTLQKTVSIREVWVPENIKADLHLMYQRPEDYLEDIINFQPNLVIVHAEARGNFYDVYEPLKSKGIKVGIALLPKTEVDLIQPIISEIDHVLIFSGDLGYFGGKADLKLLDKVKQIKSINPEIEIGWDGGVNDINAMHLAKSGVDVLNSGGFIQKSKNPKTAYNLLVQSINKV